MSSSERQLEDEPSSRSLLQSLPKQPRRSLPSRCRRLILSAVLFETTSFAAPAAAAATAAAIDASTSEAFEATSEAARVLSLCSGDSEEGSRCKAKSHSRQLAIDSDASFSGVSLAQLRTSRVAAASRSSRPRPFDPSASDYVGADDVPLRSDSIGRPDSYQLTKVVTVSVLCGIVGSLLIWAGVRIPGILFVYFGAQSGFNLYQKIVLSNATISKELELNGIPAAFFLTGVQQVVTFFLTGGVMLFLWCSQTGRKIRVPSTQQEYSALLLCSAAFAANHGFNNFCLSLVEVSLNMVLRSCLPLMTVALHFLLKQFGVKGYGVAASGTSAGEVALMLLGVLAAVVVGLAEDRGQTESGTYLTLGTIMGVISIFFAAVNLLSLEEVGKELSIPPLEATCYTAPFSAIVLLLPMFFLEHPSWEGYGLMTDWQVLRKVINLSPSTLQLVFISGVMSCMFSFLQNWLVVNLSAQYTAFAGSFNKVMSIALAIGIGIESLPTGIWSETLILAVCGNSLAFATYGYLNNQRKASLPASDESPKAIDGDKILTK